MAAYLRRTPTRMSDETVYYRIPYGPLPCRFLLNSEQTPTALFNLESSVPGVLPEEEFSLLRTLADLTPARCTTPSFPKGQTCDHRRTHGREDPSVFM